MQVLLVLAGVSTPRAGEAFNEESIKFVRSRILQHSVRVEVEACDKGDNFVGSLFLGNGENLAVLLLEAGMARVYHQSAERSPYYGDLVQAEAKAKDAKLKIWEVAPPPPAPLSLLLCLLSLQAPLLT